MNLQIPLKVILLVLAIFDFILGTIFIFFGGYLLPALNLADYVQPRFFMICVGLFLYQYVYVQFTAFRDIKKYSTCLNMTVLIRLSFPFIYISAIFLWGSPFGLLHSIFIVSAVLDLAACIFALYAMRKLGIPFFKGDESPFSSLKGPRLLRIILIMLAVAEFLISWNWIIAPKFWLRFFDIGYTVDPVWTRATGLLILNIAYIQLLGYLNVYKYRTAVITSGLFRALWPILYWYWTITGEGNSLFKTSIMFFSFFDAIMCIVIFSLLKKAMSEAKANIPVK
ncbi:MAG: hypothetical protein AAB116_05550 [Candidatus Poribacteria bacterium]